MSSLNAASPITTGLAPIALHSLTCDIARGRFSGDIQDRDLSIPRSGSSLWNGVLVRQAPAAIDVSVWSLSLELICLVDNQSQLPFIQWAFERPEEFARSSHGIALRKQGPYTSACAETQVLNWIATSDWETLAF